MQRFKKRPKPSKALVEEATGLNQGLASSMAHGLSEVPLSKVYPFLNFEEAIIFAAATWQFRSKKGKFHSFVERVSEPYILFNQVFSHEITVSGYHGSHTYQNCWNWLNTHKSVKSYVNKFSDMNPFGRNLERRLEEVSQDDFNRLKDSLVEPVCEYVFDCQYQSRKRARGGDNHKLNVMGYQNAYPPTKTKGENYFHKQMKEMVGRYCGRINELVKSYPAEHILL